MTKTIVCPECNGFGYVEEYVDERLRKNECNYCGGSRILRVPVTNADLIRSMSDDELAELFYGFCLSFDDCIDCPLHDTKCANSVFLQDWRSWISEPAED